MELSCKCRYAVLALLSLVDHYPQGEPMQIRQIAAQQHIPDRYLEQLLAILRRAGLVCSQRGARGGYLLAREPWQITLLEIMNCIEGRDPQPGNGAQADLTAERAVVDEIWQEADQAASTVLKNCTLQDLCDRRDTKKQIDLMYYI
ncbi:Rrf2 family transcriptional regulator [Acaryochloris sp. IP29b_bin.137]|uniref:RrF2 family transcriptional regulator n=1 Tax=Acaryochloris sp. IP29b_bin.137 TaxID=2969217 RepID=UPI002608C90E|nr:Rrf2 family transcriptional regulator [Acaryochloris sp. IP29b_bin.137]